MHHSYSASPWRTRRQFKSESLMKTETALLARMLETTRHFWGLGVAPLSDENVAVRVDADQHNAPFPGGGLANEQIVFA